MKTTLLVLFSCALSAFADFKTGPLFTNNMVLQRDKPVAIWGTAKPGEPVSVRFAGQKKSGVADADGKWVVTLDPMPASSSPQAMQIVSKVNGEHKKLELFKVLVGEVWFAGGQSNMARGLSKLESSKELLNSGKADIPGLNLFAMPVIINELDADTPIKGWQECSRESSAQFSAVAWHFANALKKKFKDVPVGVILSARGGTPAEAWIDKTFAADCKPFTVYAGAVDRFYKRTYKSFDEYKAAYIKSRKDKKPEPKGPYWSKRAGGLYSNMIAPLVPYAVRGVIWYQGEGNSARAYDYRTILSKLISNWRRDFNDPKLPFLVVQLTGFGLGNKKAPTWAVVRDSQAYVADNDPNVGIIPIPELGEKKDIHPRYKQPVGERLARYARGMVYGDDIQYTGPSYDSVAFSNGNALITLKNSEGLVVKGDAIHGFTIAGKDKKFVAATAELVNGKIQVSSPDVTAPTAVRYHWTNWIEPSEVNLFNGAALPLAPFRTDNFKVVTQK